MPEPRALPPMLGAVFSVSEAQDAGVSVERLRRGDLERPFHGVRARGDRSTATIDPDDPFARQASEHRARITDLLPRLRPAQFISHRSAGVEWGVPLPLIVESGRIAHGDEIPVDVSVFEAAPLPRLAGVAGHRARIRTTDVTVKDGVPITKPAYTWASLGTLPLHDVVAIGDYLCRRWRTGVGRPDAGRPPLTTPEDLRRAVASGRRVGVRRLREALGMIREDAWSPRESKLRCILLEWGLPEPELNVDVFSETGLFLGCVDLAYPHRRVAIEYLGVLHSANYAKDVERMAALRAAGWTVIEVTAELLAHPQLLVARVRAALAA